MRRIDLAKLVDGRDNYDRESGTYAIPVLAFDALVAAVRSADRVTWAVGYEDNRGHQALDDLIGKLAPFGLGRRPPSVSDPSDRGD